MMVVSVLEFHDWDDEARFVTRHEACTEPESMVPSSTSNRCQVSFKKLAFKCMFSALIFVSATTSVIAFGAETTAAADAKPAPKGAESASDAQKAQSPAEELFVSKCGSCHTIGSGPRVGPDLKDAHKRRDRAWLGRIIRVPSSMLDSDADARQLVAQFNGVRMPDLGLTEEQATSLVDLIEKCSTQPCNLAAAFTPAVKAQPGDIARGMGLFVGDEPLKNGAAPCISCHVAGNAGGIAGGGVLAKDLTRVFARLGDEGLDAALKSPQFPLMNKIFAEQPLTAEEAFALRAFLYDSNRSSASPVGGQSVPLVGLSGAALVLIVLNAIWARERTIRKNGNTNEKRRTP